MDIGQRLRNLIEEKDITQKELANALNISTSTINGYLKNRRQPDPNTLARLASFFDTKYGLPLWGDILKEPPASPYSAEERHLVELYRAIPEGKHPLFIEIGKQFANDRARD